VLRDAAQKLLHVGRFRQLARRCGGAGARARRVAGEKDRYDRDHHDEDDHRIARYLLPFPVIGAGVSVYHLLVENGVVEQQQACLVTAGGCATKWINEFGYMTIPTLALTGFALTFAFLLLASFEPKAATLEPAHA